MSTNCNEPAFGDEAVTSPLDQDRRMVLCLRARFHSLQTQQIPIRREVEVETAMRDGGDLLDVAVEAHVALLGVAPLGATPAIAGQAVVAGKVQVVGAVYDLANGGVALVRQRPGRSHPAALGRIPRPPRIQGRGWRIVLRRSATSRR